MKTILLSLGFLALCSINVIAQTLKLSTYIGGDGTEWVLDIEFDSAANILLTGSATNSVTFPVTAPAQGPTGIYDIFVSHIDATTGALIKSRVIGGTGSEVKSSLDRDDSGFIYLAGETNSTDFPVASAIQVSNAGNSDGYICKLSESDYSIVASTFLGGSGFDRINDIAVDRTSGSIYVCGLSASADFPATIGASPANDTDIVVAKFSADMQALEFSRAYGGSGVDVAYGLTITNAGHLVVTGSTSSNDWALSATYGPTTGASIDGLVLWLDSANGNVTHSVRYGGEQEDQLYAIRSDSLGRVLVGGISLSSGIPWVKAFQSFNAGGGNACLAMFSSSGDSVLYSGYFGGSGRDIFMGVGFDDSGYAYGTGESQSTNIRTWPYAPFQGAKNGAADPIAVKLDLKKPYVTYATYIGGTHYQGSVCGQVGPNGEFCFGGTTKSSDYPVENAFQSTLTGAIFDGFVTCFEANNDVATCCRVAGDANHSGTVDIGDVTFLIVRIFSGGPAPPCYQEAEAAGQGVSIGAVTFLISRIFSNGPPPTCGRALSD